MGQSSDDLWSHVIGYLDLCNPHHWRLSKKAWPREICNSRNRGPSELFWPGEEVGGVWLGARTQSLRDGGTGTIKS